MQCFVVRPTFQRCTPIQLQCFDDSFHPSMLFSTCRDEYPTLAYQWALQSFPKNKNFEWRIWSFILYYKKSMSCDRKLLNWNNTFVGNGQSSRSKVIFAGPSGSLIGITSTMDWTTCNHPSSLSAILCNLRTLKILNRWNNNFHKDVVIY